MKIDIITPNAALLRNAIFRAVKNGRLETWEITETEDDGYYLTPVGVQFNNIVLLRLELMPFSKNLVIFPTNFREKEDPTDALIAIVLGMVTATLLTHFSKDFSKLETTN